MPDLTTTIFADADLPDDLRALHRAWDRECFTEPNAYTWTRPQWHVWVYAGGSPVSYVGIFSRQCTLDGEPIHLAGIGSVMTPIAHRKQGYATAGLQAANAYIREAIRAPFAQLVTDKHLIPFYARHGWRQIHDPVLVELPDGTQTHYEGVVMILELAERPWPGGTLDLRGKPW